MDAQTADDLQRIWRDAEYARTISKDQLLLFSARSSVLGCGSELRGGGGWGIT